MLLSRILVAATSLAAALSAQSVGDESSRTDQEVRADEIIDHGFKIAIGKPSGWRMLDEEAVSHLNGDAILGWNHPTQGLFGVVICEPINDRTLDEFNEFAVNGLSQSYEQVRVESTEVIEIDGTRAIQTALRGVANEVPIRLLHFGVESSGYYYQVIGFGMQVWVRSAERTFAMFAEKVRFLPGEVPGRIAESVDANIDGVGWRLRERRFESAIDGLVIDCPEDWNFVHGVELFAMNEDARIGFQHSSPDIYAVLIPERIEDSIREDSIRTALDSMTFNLGVDPDRSFDLEVLGQNVTFTARTADVGVDARFVHGILRRPDGIVQILVWWPNPRGVKDEIPVKEICSGLSEMDGELEQQLRREMLGTRDPQTRVGNDFALRAGAYRDYLYDFRWNKPADEFCQMSCGQEARMANEDSRLFIDFAERGIYALAIPESKMGESHRAYHVLLIENTTGEDLDDEPTTQTLGDQEFLISQFDLELGDATFEYLLATTTTEKRNYQFLFWGFSGAIESNREFLMESLERIRIVPTGLESQWETGDGVADDRFGWSFDPPGSGWNHVEFTPPGTEAALRVASFIQEADRKAIHLLSVYSPDVRGDQWMIDYAATILGERLPPSVRIDTDAKPDPIDLDGRQGLHWPGSGSRQHNHLVLVRDHDLIFGLVVQNDSSDPLDLADVLRRIQWLD
ncbi:MAG: hypothetical protein AAF196_10485 [Planctomycetota bacterium]